VLGGRRQQQQQQQRRRRLELLLGLQALLLRLLLTDLLVGKPPEV
jgi:hypothetical protein